MPDGVDLGVSAQNILLETNRLRGTFNLQGTPELFQQNIESLFSTIRVGGDLYRPPPQPMTIGDINQIFTMTPGMPATIRGTQEYPLRTYGLAIPQLMQAAVPTYLSLGMFSDMLPQAIRPFFAPAEAVWQGMERLFPGFLQFGVSPQFQMEAARYAGMTISEFRGLGWLGRTQRGLRYIMGAPDVYSALGRLEMTGALGLGQLATLGRITERFARMANIGRTGLTILRAGRLATEFALGGFLLEIPFRAAETAIGGAVRGAMDVAQYNQLADLFVRGTLEERREASNLLRRDLYADIERNIPTMVRFGISPETIRQQRALAVGLAGVTTPTRFGRTDIEEFRKVANDFVQVLRELSRSTRGVSDELIRSVTGLMAPGLQRLPAALRAPLVGDTLRRIAAGADIHGIPAQQLLSVVTSGAQEFASAGMNQALALSWAARIATTVATPEDIQIMLPAVGQMYRHPVSVAMQFAAMRGIPMGQILQGGFVPTDTRSLITGFMRGRLLMGYLGPTAMMQGYRGLFSDVLSQMGMEITPETLGFIAMAMGFANTPEEAMIVGQNLMFGNIRSSAVDAISSLRAKAETYNRTWFSRLLRDNAVTGPVVQYWDLIKEDLAQKGLAISRFTGDILSASSSTLQTAIDRFTLKIGKIPRPGELYIDVKQLERFLVTKEGREYSAQISELQKQRETAYTFRESIKQRFGSAYDDLENRALAAIRQAHGNTEQATMIMASYLRNIALSTGESVTEEAAAAAASDVVKAATAPKSKDLSQKEIAYKQAELFLKNTPDFRDYLEKHNLKIIPEGVLKVSMKQEERAFASFDEQNAAKNLVLGNVLYQSAKKSGIDVENERFRKMFMDVIFAEPKDKRAKAVRTELQRFVTQLAGKTEEQRRTIVKKMAPEVVETLAAYGIGVTTAERLVGTLAALPGEQLLRGAAELTLAEIGIPEKQRARLAEEVTKLAPMITGKKIEDFEKQMDEIKKLAEKSGTDLTTYISKMDEMQGFLLMPFLTDDKKAIRVKTI